MSVQLWNVELHEPDAPILEWDLHVGIFDGRDGRQLADIDAHSVAEAMAFYLRSRRVDLLITTEDIEEAAGTTDRRDKIVRNSRHPITGVLEHSLWGEVLP